MINVEQNKILRNLINIKNQPKIIIKLKDNTNFYIRDYNFDFIFQLLYFNNFGYDECENLPFDELLKRPANSKSNVFIFLIANNFLHIFLENL